MNFPILARHIRRKSSSLDPLPSNVFLSQLDLLLPVLHDIANRSLESSIFPHSLKWAVVTPLLKKASLNHEVLRNYRPISNLNVVSKIVEKVVASRLNDYLVLNHLDELLQSAYKRFHDCETALVRVHNNVLRSVDNHRCVVLLLLDLSAAFDTVDHALLLSRLHSKFGICGKALQWFEYPSRAMTKLALPAL